MTLSGNHPNGSSNGMQEKLLKQNHDLIDSIKKLNDDKAGLKNALVKLEEEICHYKRNHKNDQVATLSDHDREKVKKKIILFYIKSKVFNIKILV
jgi:hypothetical protein